MTDIKQIRELLSIAGTIAWPLGIVPSFHQVAIHTPDLFGGVEMLKLLGATDWYYDTAELYGCIEDRPPTTIKAHMAFNYQILGGLELELLHYEGESRHSGRSGAFISHISTYVDDINKSMRFMKPTGFRVCHTFETRNHTNPKFKGTNRKFIEVIYDTRETLGFDIKLIEKVY